jgi:putative protease
MNAATANPSVTPGETPSPRPPSRPELLAPAGDWECAKAAVENGADAIYFGLDRFNARMRAHNFTDSDLPRLMKFLHRRGVKGYVTFNTLVFANEMGEAEQHLRAIIAAGVDAAIVQDVGICRLIRRLSPDFPIHASTQMTITSAGGVEFARDLGCQLVVLARECSIKEIEKIYAQLSPVPNSAIHNLQSAFPLEVFVHGALCVAYSGQCLTSESLGGRSANRGECAQACRMPYELISDGKTVPLGDKRYLLSPQDLASVEVLPALIRAGVASLKIEGRLKTPEYVANITRVYRQALDDLRGERNESNARQVEPARKSEIENRQYDLEMAFSRGLYTGWMRGVNNKELVHARFGKKRGVFLGEVHRVQGELVALELVAPLKPGDGVVFDSGHPDEEEEGGRVYTVSTRGRETLIGFGHGDLDFTRIHPGDKLWKTSDPELDRRLRQSFAGDQPHFQRPIDLEVHGQADVPMTVIARDEIGHVVEVQSAMPMAAAEKQPLSEEKLRAQLGRLGGTPFVLGELKNLLAGQLMLPVSELNRLRREFVAQLETLRCKPKKWSLNTGNIAPLDFGPGKAAGREAELIVLVRNLPQLEAALRCSVQTVYCDFADPKKYRDAVRMFKEFPGRVSNAAIYVAPPRIFKMGEEWTLKQVRSSEADGYLIRNYDHLKYFGDCRRVGDFSFNVANALSADYFKNHFGLERVTASYDLNHAQLEALLQSAPPEWFEITIHQHMPMFHMEHCVYCAFLSKGTDYTNCGRPCDTHEVALRDRVGAVHPLAADIGCRNTVFNAVAQTGAEFAGRMLTLGARHFRIEFLNESPDQTRITIGKYRQLLKGEIDGASLWRELKLINQLGVTRGPMAG